MNGLNKTILNKELNLESREVAEMCGKEHSKLLRDIRTYCEYLTEAKIGLGSFFEESKYIDKNNQARLCFNITKMGCEMIANKMIGFKGTVFTAKYVKKFNMMERKFKTPKTYKEALLVLVAEEEEKEKLQLEKEHKQEIINGLTDNVSVTTKKDIINRVVRWKKANYRNRYNQIYQSFREIYHIDLKARTEGYNMKQIKAMDKLSVIKYTDRMGYISKLYNIASKLYESDINEIKEFLGLIY